MAVSKVNEILETQKRLAEQLRMTQQQQAQDTYNQGQRALSEQLRGQRLENQSNRESLAQQAYLAQRNIQQGATSRGLGGSGLRDLATIQSQQAQGEGLRNLAGINASVQREGLNSRLALQDQLRQGNMASEADYLNRLSQTDQFALQREDMDRDTLMQLLEMTQAEGANPELLNQMAQVAFGENYANVMKNLGLGGTNENGETVDNPLLDLMPDNDEDAKETYNRVTNSKITDILSAVDPVRWVSFVNSRAFDLFRDPSKKKKEHYLSTAGVSDATDNLVNLLRGTAGKEDYKRWYMVDGKRQEMTKSEILKHVTDKHSKKPLIKSGEVKITVSNGGDIHFVTKKGRYSSYAKAEKSLK